MSKQVDLVHMNAYVPSEHSKQLVDLAVKRFEGNYSMAARYVIRLGLRALESERQHTGSAHPC